MKIYICPICKEEYSDADDMIECYKSCAGDSDE